MKAAKDTSAPQQLPPGLRVRADMSFSGPLLKIRCPDADCPCDVCRGRSALTLDYDLGEGAGDPLQLCPAHLCELASDVPALLEDLMACLVELARAQTAGPAELVPRSAIGPLMPLA